MGHLEEHQPQWCRPQCKHEERDAIVGGVSQEIHRVGQQRDRIRAQPAPDLHAEHRGVDEEGSPQHLQEARRGAIRAVIVGVSAVVPVMAGGTAAMVVGRKSPYSRYSEKMATYGKGDKFDQSLAEGFIKLWTVPFQRHGK